MAFHIPFNPSFTSLTGDTLDTYTINGEPSKSLGLPAPTCDPILQPQGQQSSGYSPPVAVGVGGLMINKSDLRKANAAAGIVPRHKGSNTGKKLGKKVPGQKRKVVEVKKGGAVGGDDDFEMKDGGPVAKGKENKKPRVEGTRQSKRLLKEAA
ncbi:hypothetical protein LTR17_011296 [Elasticomyces elasticus]|nr:hypothetical protein LTR17_011296 [Elasticomyces elasticus]